MSKVTTDFCFERNLSNEFTKDSKGTRAEAVDIIQMRNDYLYQGVIQKSRKSWILEIFCRWSWREFADGMTVG